MNFRETRRRPPDEKHWNPTARDQNAEATGQSGLKPVPFPLRSQFPKKDKAGHHAPPFLHQAGMIPSFFCKRHERKSLLVAAGPIVVVGPFPILCAFSPGAWRHIFRQLAGRSFIRCMDFHFHTTQTWLARQRDE